MESAYEYGSRVASGVSCASSRAQLIPTIYAVGMALERNPQAPRTVWRVRAATSSITGGAGSTITASTKATEREAYPPLRRDPSATDRDAADRLVHRHAERQYTGAMVVRSGFLYDSDAYNDRTALLETYDYGRPHLHHPTRSTTTTRASRVAWAGVRRGFLRLAARQFRRAAPRGEQAPKMMTVALHCRLAGKRRAPRICPFVDHILRTTGSGSADATRSPSIGGASTQRPERKDERTCYL